MDCVLRRTLSSRAAPIGGGPLVDLPAGDAQIRNIAWSPDNRTILADGFQTQTGWALYDRVDGTRRPLWADRDPLQGRRRISDLRQPAWSPDGRSIAAIVNGRDGQELWTIAADGSSASAQRMAHRIAFPAWTPRGEIACVATADGRARVTIPCGGAVVKTDPDLDVYGPIAFSPDAATVYLSLANRVGHARPVGGAVRRRTRAPADRRSRATPTRRPSPATAACCSRSRATAPSSRSPPAIRRTEPAARDVSKRNAVLGSDRPAARDHLRHVAPGRGRCALSGHRAGRRHHRGGSGESRGAAVERRARVGVGGPGALLVAERQVDRVSLAQGSVRRHLAAAGGRRHAAAPHQLSGPRRRSRLAALVAGRPLAAVRRREPDRRTGR